MGLGRGRGSMVRGRVEEVGGAMGEVEFEVGK